MVKRKIRPILISTTLSVATMAMFAAIVTPAASAAPAAVGSSTSVSASTTAPDCSASVAGQALDRSAWVASTNAKPRSADAAANAVDGNLGTRFSTDQAQAANLYFEVDMGAKATFDELSMAVPNSPTDYARGYGVQVSNDGKSWATVATCSGTSTPEVVSFAAQTAQYVRVFLTASSTYWWSIDEFNVYSVSGAPPSITSAASVDVTPGTATSFTVTSAGSPVPSLSESGTLPPGLAFHASTNGTAVDRKSVV